MTQSNNTDRFTGLAEIYASHRPTYPAEVLTALAARANASGAPKIAIDIGAGTGISTLVLAKALPQRAKGVQPGPGLQGVPGLEGPLGLRLPERRGGGGCHRPRTA